MGFRKGAYARVWEVKESENGRYSDARITISKKNDSGGYDQQFSGFVRLVGDAHELGKQISESKTGTPIQIGDCDVTNRYIAEKKITYYNFAIFSFEFTDSKSKKQSDVKSAKPTKNDEPDPDEDIDDLPF